MDELERALQANRSQIERSIRDAEVELEALRDRQEALKKLIERARFALGLDAQRGQDRVAGPTGSELLLHEALVRILRDQGNRPMTARELADEVNRAGLYRKRDGSPVEGGQIHARVHNYSRLFVREDRRIRLREAEPRFYDPKVIEQFNHAMQGVYDSALHEVGYSARRFLGMLRRRGGLEAAQHLLANDGESEGFRRLAKAGKLRLTMEYQVLRPDFVGLFTDDERAVARQRLVKYGLSESALP